MGLLGIVDIKDAVSPENLEFVYQWALSTGVNALGAAGILIIGLWLAGRVRNIILRIGRSNARFDAALTGFLAALARYAAITLTVMMALERFDVETTSLGALIGAAGLAIGLALQGTLSNLAAGAVLLAFRPFNPNDFVEVAGLSGAIRTIGLFTIEMTTPDNVQIILPNSSVWGAAIRNCSVNATRRLDMIFGASCAANLKPAEGVIGDLTDKEPRVMADQASLATAPNLGDSSVDFTVHLWCAANDYWNFKFDFIRAVKEAFDEAVVDIPFPTRTLVHASPAA